MPKKTDDKTHRYNSDAKTKKQKHHLLKLTLRIASKTIACFSVHICLLLSVLSKRKPFTHSYNRTRARQERPTNETQAERTLFLGQLPAETFGVIPRLFRTQTATDKFDTGGKTKVTRL